MSVIVEHPLWCAKYRCTAGLGAGAGRHEGKLHKIRMRNYVGWPASNLAVRLWAPVSGRVRVELIILGPSYIDREALAEEGRPISYPAPTVAATVLRVEEANLLATLLLDLEEAART